MTWVLEIITEEPDLEFVLHLEWQKRVFGCSIRKFTLIFLLSDYKNLETPRTDTWSIWMKRLFLSYFEVNFSYIVVSHRHICLQEFRSSIRNSSLFCLQEPIALLLIHWNRISIDATKNGVHSTIEYCRSGHVILVFYASSYI